MFFASESIREIDTASLPIDPRSNLHRVKYRDHGITALSNQPASKRKRPRSFLDVAFIYAGNDRILS
jgi:hypothetical protein